MFRFVMPEHTLPVAVREQHLKEQMDAFLHSDALGELFELLKTDRARIGRDYNGRAGGNGRVLETQMLKPSEELEPIKGLLYPLLDELGFMRINQPLANEHSRILVLGGAFDFCFKKAQLAAEWKDPGTLSVDGLSCYRPINPREREASAFSSSSDTEFGAMADALSEAFGLSDCAYEDSFVGDRNLNRVSCIRAYEVRPDVCQCRVYAAPSSAPELRRADTADTLMFYMENAGVSAGESLLAVTANRYCNRQFLQLAHYVIKNDLAVDLDVAGCIPDERVITADAYDPFQFLQDLIGILDWIDRFQA